MKKKPPHIVEYEVLQAVVRLVPESGKQAMAHGTQWHRKGFTGAKDHERPWVNVALHHVSEGCNDCCNARQHVKECYRAMGLPV